MFHTPKIMGTVVRMMGTNREHAKEHQMCTECFRMRTLLLPPFTSGAGGEAFVRYPCTRVTAFASRDKADEETIEKGPMWKESVLYSLLWWPSAGGRPTR